MLNRLSIKNYALINEIDISFSKGLTIITGETGAGKSIILGALSLILGQRSESKYFFNQEKKCIIEGYFNIESYDLHDFFKENDIDYEAQTILRREILNEGKSRSFINDTPVTLSILKALGERLIAIHSQHAVLEINKESFQLLTLDSIAENTELLTNFQSSYKNLKEFSSTLEALESKAAKIKAEADYHQFLFDELEAAQLNSDEQDSLEEELNRLTHSEEIKRNLQNFNHLVSEQEQPALVLIKDSISKLEQVEHFLPQLKDLLTRLRSSYLEIKDISEEVAMLESETSVNEERSQIIQDRLSLLFRLQQKHQVNTVSELIEIQFELGEKIEAVSLNDELIKELLKNKEKAEKQSRDLASQLTASRRKAIPKIESRIHDILKKAGMPQSVFKIELTDLEENQLRSTGKDRIQFNFSANAGQIPQPVNKVASGGELSRLMLAIKSIIAETTSLPTIIFDEIDTGISGEIAIKVGEIMEDLGANLQVIAITHLPQIAAKGTSHFKVYKTQNDSGTSTNIGLLNSEERIQEIAQMLGGAKPSETAFMHAKELLN
jgi:DNA repair protein RecN (Recombination protein N)